MYINQKISRNLILLKSHTFKMRSPPKKSKNRQKQGLNGSCDGYFTNLTPDLNSSPFKMLNLKISRKSVKNSNFAKKNNTPRSANRRYRLVLAVDF
jgi:hypothetical protein